MKVRLFLSFSLAGTLSLLSVSAQTGTGTGGASTSGAAGATLGNAPGVNANNTGTDSSVLSGARSSTQLQPQAPNANTRIPQHGQPGQSKATVPATSSTALGGGAVKAGGGVGIGAGASKGLGIGAASSSGVGIGAGASTGQGQITPGTQAPTVGRVPHANPSAGTLGRGTLGSGVLGGGVIRQPASPMVQRNPGLITPNTAGSGMGRGLAGTTVTNPAGNPVNGSLSGTTVTNPSGAAVGGTGTSLGGTLNGAGIGQETDSLTNGLETATNQSINNGLRQTVPRYHRLR